MTTRLAASSSRSKPASPGERRLLRMFNTNRPQEPSWLVTIAEAAALARVSQKHIRTAIRSKMLSAFYVDGKSLRIRREALQNYIRSLELNQK